MKNISLVIIVSLFFSSAYFFTSCKKDETPTAPSEAEIIENNIQTLLDSIIENTHVPGMVAGVWAPNEGIDLVYTAGVSNIETNASMDADMIFRIGSNTKTFTITVLLQLVDEGLISLNDPLSDYLPDFPRANEVTIEMLTNMRSGIFCYMDLIDELWIKVLYTDPTKFWSTDELIALGASGDYYFDPGTDIHYSNTNTIIIQKIIEIVTGNSLESNIKTRIIDKLNLVNTAYLISGINIPGFHSSAYYYGEYDPEFPECSEYYDVSCMAAAGSAVSDIYELKKYVKALVDGEFLSAETQQKRMVCPETNSHYGLGILNYKDFYGHNGSMPGYTSLMMYSPERNCTMIVWYNCQLDDATPDILMKLIPELIYSDF
jgi:D-alanyl-D-alanine carboxypeptidase